MLQDPIDFLLPPIDQKLRQERVSLLVDKSVKNFATLVIPPDRRNLSRIWGALRTTTSSGMVPK
jgi:hypothetical protein